MRHGREAASAILSGLRRCRPVAHSRPCVAVGQRYVIRMDVRRRVRSQPGEGGAQVSGFDSFPTTKPARVQMAASKRTQKTAIAWQLTAQDPAA